MNQGTLLTLLGAALALVALSLVACGVEEPPPDPTAELREVIKEQDARLAALEQKLEEVDDLELRVKEQAALIARLQTELAELPSAAEEEEEEAAPGASAAEEMTPEKLFAKQFGTMIRQRAKQGAMKYIDELMEPTEQSEARRIRQLERSAERAADAMGLDERDRAELARILKEVDDRRRERFRGIVDSKASREDITYDEVKVVLDDSFAEEDRQVERSLGSDKAKDYQKTAEPVRTMIYTGAKAAFPTAEEVEKRE